MSFILDAIKKSENERQRSRQPDVHSLQDSMPPSQAEPSSGNRLLLLVIAIVIIIAAFWWLWIQVSPQISPRLVELLQNTQTVKNDQAATNNDKPASTSLSQTPSPTSNPVNDVSSISSFLADDELPPNSQIKELWQLPADYQSTIPELDFSFHVFSNDHEERMIIINGRRMREGQMVSRGLTLRVITETGVILHSGDQFFHVDVIEKW
jgi:general secretion pathway protein B